MMHDAILCNVILSWRARTETGPTDMHGTPFPGTGQSEGCFHPPKPHGKKRTKWEIKSGSSRLIRKDRGQTEAASLDQHGHFGQDTSASPATRPGTGNKLPAATACAGLKGKTLYRGVLTETHRRPCKDGGKYLAEATTS